MTEAIRPVARTVRAEWSRFWSVRSSTTLVAVIIAGALGAATLAASQSAATAPAGGSPWILASIIGLPILFGILILMSIASTSDYSTGNIVSTLQWSPRRGVFFASRVAVLTMLGLLIGLLLVAATATLLWGFAPQLTYFASADWSQVGGIALVFASATLLTVGTGFALRSTAGTLAVSFALILVLPLLLQVIPFDWVNRVIEVLPGSAALFFLLGEGPGDTQMTALSSIVVLVAWAVGATAAGAWRLLRFDADS